MDIKYIIKLLQDTDKIKLVIFDESQRKLFETLPKPGIVGKRKNKDCGWTIDDIIKTRKFTLKPGSREKFDFSDHPYTKRILELLNYSSELGKIIPKGFS